MSPRAEFLYRAAHSGWGSRRRCGRPALRCPIDLLRFFRSRRAELVTTSAELRFGLVGRLLPVEMQGSTVMAWRATDLTGRER